MFPAGFGKAAYMNDMASTSMTAVKSSPRPASCTSFRRVRERMRADGHFLNTGVPHAVAFLDKLEDLNISRLGAYLRYHEAFSPKGTNANFARILSPGHIAIRTYERGVEDETLACGTGMTACALLHAVLADAPSPIQVDVAGGDTLKVGFQRTGDRFTDVTLTGPADLVFTGDIQI
jgi:diaminopimelate epimerase